MVKKTGDLLRPRQRRQSHLLQRLDLQAVEYGPIDEDRIQLSADIVANRLSIDTDLSARCKLSRFPRTSHGQHG
jgi:hypothetical protein